MQRRQVLAVALAAPAIILFRERRARAFDNEPFTVRNPDRIVGKMAVRFRTGVDPRTDPLVQKIFARHSKWNSKVRVTHSHDALVPGSYNLACPPGEEVTLAQDLISSDLVMPEMGDHETQRVHPAIKHAGQLSVFPNDTNYIATTCGNTHAFTALGVEEVWPYHKMSDYPLARQRILSGIDTGGVQGTFSASPSPLGTFTPTHPDFLNVLPGYNVQSGDGNVTGGDHSIGCGSLAGATPNNASGIADIGWGSLAFVPGVVVDNLSEPVLLAWLVANYAAPAFIHYALYFNSNPGQPYRDAFVAAGAAGWLTFAATGDSGVTPCKWGPCDCPPGSGVIGVVATYGLGVSPYNRANYSNFGGASIGGGGVGANMACIGGQLSGFCGIPVLKTSSGVVTDGSFVGTSPACAIAAGIARFLSTVFPGLTQRAIYNLMTDQTLVTPATDSTPLGTVNLPLLFNAATARASIIHG